MDLVFTFQQVQTVTEAAAGIGALYAYRLNSLYDPNATGTGVQPVGYDQWSALFNRSVVWRCRAEVELANAGTTISELGVFPLIGASFVPTSAPAFAMQYGSKSGLMAVNGRNVFRYARNFDIARLFGVSKQRLLSEEDYSESPAGPAVAGNNQAFLYLYCRGLGTIAVMAVKIKLIYTAHLFDPLSYNES